jgi:hypothetical protein
MFIPWEYLNWINGEEAVRFLSSRNKVEKYTQPEATWGGVNYRGCPQSCASCIRGWKQILTSIRGPRGMAGECRVSYWNAATGFPSSSLHVPSLSSVQGALEPSSSIGGSTHVHLQLHDIMCTKLHFQRHYSTSRKVAGSSSNEVN